MTTNRKTRGDHEAHEARLDAVRHFEARLGDLLRKTESRVLEETGFSPVELRVFREIAESPHGTTASWMCCTMGFDDGNVSRVLARLRQLRFTARRASPWDARIQYIFLSPTGGLAFRQVRAAERRLLVARLAHLDDRGERRLVEAMRTIEALLKPPGAMDSCYDSPDSSQGSE